MHRRRHERHERSVRLTTVRDQAQRYLKEKAPGVKNKLDSIDGDIQDDIKRLRIGAVKSNERPAIERRIRENRKEIERIRRKFKQEHDKKFGNLKLTKDEQNLVDTHFFDVLRMRD